MDAIKVEITPKWNCKHQQAEIDRIAVKTDEGQPVVGIHPPHKAFIPAPDDCAVERPKHIVIDLVIEQKRCVVFGHPIGVVFLFAPLHAQAHEPQMERPIPKG